MPAAGAKTWPFWRGRRHLERHGRHRALWHAPRPSTAAFAAVGRLEDRGAEHVEGAKLSRVARRMAQARHRNQDVREKSRPTSRGGDHGAAVMTLWKRRAGAPPGPPRDAGPSRSRKASRPSSCRPRRPSARTTSSQQRTRSGGGVPFDLFQAGRSFRGALTPAHRTIYAHVIQREPHEGPTDAPGASAEG